MTKTLRILLLLLIACVCQTNLVQYLRIADVAPDMLIVFLVLLTEHCGAYGGFCAGAVLAMLYDASVGYVLAINLVAYTFIGWAAAMLRSALEGKLRGIRHRHYMEMILITLLLTLMREALYIGYLFLIGSEQSLVTLVRMVLCAVYSALMVVPASLISHRVMRARPRPKAPGQWDFQDDDVTEPHR